jgi:hypothetical protein
MADVTFDGFTILGDRRILANPNEYPHGMWFGDYMTKNVVIRNANIQGMRYGIIDPYYGGYTTTIENSYLRNTANIVVRNLGAPGSDPNGAHRSPKSLIIRDVLFGSTAGWNVGGVTRANIAMEYWQHSGSANLIAEDTVFVYNYNRVAGDDFQVYYQQQAPNFVVPQSSGNLVGAPVAGLTNLQLWNQYGIAFAGAVAPTIATRTDIIGFVRVF